MADTKDSAPKNERLFGLDSSLKLADGRPLGSFVLGVDRLGAFSLITGVEVSEVVHILGFSDVRLIQATETIDAQSAQTSLAEASTLSAIESTQTAASIVPTDSAPLSVSESVGSTATVTIADSTYLSISEASSTFSTLALNEAATISVAEDLEQLTNISVTFSDTVTLGMSESIESATSIGPIVDLGPLTATETYVEHVDKTQDIVDAHIIRATEEMGIVSIVDVLTDDSMLHSSDAYLPTTTTTTVAETILLTVDESIINFADTATVDSGVVTGTDQYSSVRTSVLSETNNITSSDVLTTEGISTYSESVTLTVVEAYSEYVDATSEYPETYHIAATEQLSIVSIVTTLTDASLVSVTENKVQTAQTVADDTSFIDSSETLTPTAAMHLSVQEPLTVIDTLPLTFLTMTNLETEEIVSLGSSSIVGLSSEVYFYDDPVVVADDLYDALAELDIVRVYPLLAADIIVRINTEIPYDALQTIGGMLRVLVDYDELAIIRTTTTDDIAIAPVTPEVDLSAVRQDVDDYVSVSRTTPPEPTVNRTDPIGGVSMKQSKPVDTVATSRTSPDISYGIARIFKGEL